jgi:hypothetical protein
MKRRQIITSLGAVLGVGSAAAVREPTPVISKISTRCELSESVQPSGAGESAMPHGPSTVPIQTSESPPDLPA